MIRRLLLIGLTGAAAVALVSALSAPASTNATRLVGTTGPEAVITLKKGGKRVTTLKPGRYAITVSDRERVHDFHLRGPKLEKTITTSFFQGTRTVTLFLKKGRYTYYCEPHEFAGMKGSFTVR